MANTEKRVSQKRCGSEMSNWAGGLLVDAISYDLQMARISNFVYYVLRQRNGRSMLDVFFIFHKEYTKFNFCIYTNSHLLPAPVLRIRLSDQLSPYLMRISLKNFATKHRIIIEKPQLLSGYFLAVNE